MTRDAELSLTENHRDGRKRLEMTRTDPESLWRVSPHTRRWSRSNGNRGRCAPTATSPEPKPCLLAPTLSGS